MLSDHHSRHLLDRVVRFRQTFSIEDYVEPDGSLEYFPEDVPLFNHNAPTRFVDCGAYTGDTVEALLSRLPGTPEQVEYVISYEPDRDNFVRLCDHIDTLSATHTDVTFLPSPLGVWSSTDMLSFKTRGDSSSSVTHDRTGNCAVPVIALDNTVRAARPTYIKMDIEGAESAAVEGAKHLIAEQAPTLAMCVYHRPEDLWRLPIQIKQLQPDYRMYLRVHGHMGLSTVLYCVPD